MASFLARDLSMSDWGWSCCCCPLSLDIAVAAARAESYPESSGSTEKIDELMEGSDPVRKSPREIDGIAEESDGGEFDEEVDEKDEFLAVAVVVADEKVFERFVGVVDAGLLLLVYLGGVGVLVADAVIGVGVGVGFGLGFGA